MNELEAALLLNMVPGIGAVRFQNLKDTFGSLATVFQVSKKELLRVEGLSEKIISSILAYANRLYLAKEEMELADQHGIKILSLNDSNYPTNLKMIYNPPPILYVKGDFSLLESDSLALVGTRTPTPYGEKVTAGLVKELVEFGLISVSGLARGIDTIVHRATLGSKGKTIAVLGSGLLKLYPPENKKLAEIVAENGALVSEFSLKVFPEPGHFPRRNRIISGISLGTVVIEAGQISGALITARLALEQGKDVFAVPGAITSKMSIGPNQLIKQGAKLVEKIEDILEEIGSLKEKFNCFKESRKESISAELKESELSAKEKNLAGLIDFEPASIDFLSERSPLSQGDFAQSLLNLEIKGIVKSLPGKRYVRV